MLLFTLVSWFHLSMSRVKYLLYIGVISIKNTKRLWKVANLCSAYIYTWVNISVWWISEKLFFNIRLYASRHCWLRISSKSVSRWAARLCSRIQQGRLACTTAMLQWWFEQLRCAVSVLEIGVYDEESRINLWCYFKNSSRFCQGNGILITGMDNILSTVALDMDAQFNQDLPSDAR